MLDIVSTSPSIKRYRLLPLSVTISALVIFWALTIAAIYVSDWRHEPLSTDGWVWAPRVASVFTGCLAIAFLFFSETQIDVERGAIVDVVRFLGVWTVRERHWGKNEFAGIRCKCYRKSDGRRSKHAAYDDGLRDDWIVELHPRLGRPILVRQFSTECGSAECPEARAFARQLSELTGLEVLDDAV
jgi:hypothetical protein